MKWLMRQNQPKKKVRFIPEWIVDRLSHVDTPEGDECHSEGRPEGLLARSRKVSLELVLKVFVVAAAVLSVKRAVFHRLLDQNESSLACCFCEQHYLQKNPSVIILSIFSYHDHIWLTCWARLVQILLTFPRSSNRRSCSSGCRWRRKRWSRPCPGRDVWEEKSVLITVVKLGMLTYIESGIKCKIGLTLISQNWLYFDFLP